MASTPTVELLRGLVLSASELKAMTDWPDALVEDYLSLLDNIITISEIVDQKQDLSREVVSVSTADSPYAVNNVDQEYVFDTTGGDILVFLNAGVDGRSYRMTNIGASGNKVVITPLGLELLFGENLDQNLYDAETFEMSYKSPSGWW